MSVRVHSPFVSWFTWVLIAAWLGAVAWAWLAADRGS